LVYPVAMLALFLATLPVPVNLDTITLDRARTHDGRVVLASVLVGKPAYCSHGFTIAGSAGLPDGAERSAVWRGFRRVEEGKRYEVLGRLRVIEHPAVWVYGNTFIERWVEIRVEER
jgi:hypothetical protein